MTLVNYFPDFLLLLRDVQGQSETVAQRQADARTAQDQIGKALDSLRYATCCFKAHLLPLADDCLTLMQVGFLLRWAGCMVSALVTKTRRFTQAFGELPETHSEPQIDFSTCYGACGLKAPVANPQTRIRAPACKAANLTLPSVRLISSTLCNRAKYCQVPQDDPAGVVRCNSGWVVDSTKSLPILIVVANKFINATCQERGYDPSSAQCSKHLAFNQAFVTQAQVWATSLSGQFWNNGDYW
jgi:hypothetical protein